MRKGKRPSSLCLEVFPDLMFKGLRYYEDPPFAPEFNYQGDSPTDKGSREEMHLLEVGEE